MAHTCTTSYTAPMQQQPPSVASVQLTSVTGVAIRQVPQFKETLAKAFGVPWEAQNKYRMMELPAGAHARRSFKQHSGFWSPTGEELEGLPEFVRVAEESGTCLRILATLGGCANLRALKLHFTDTRNPLAGQPEFMVVERDCRLGASCCCPLETRVMTPGAPQPMVGMVREDCSLTKCCEAAWCCTVYARVDQHSGAGPQHRFTVRAGLCCCGAHNNCCTNTCCRHDRLMDILDPKGRVVATLQQTYAPEDMCCSAYWRMSQKFNNYILEFPPDASEEERRLLTAAVFHLDYQLFEVACPGDPMKNVEYIGG